MTKLIECVPNFSEGRDKNKIDKIANSITSIPDVKLLHIDTGFDANRTVITFAGSPEGVEKAAYESIKTAAQEIDMRKHRGTHPRIGATDVFPLIPLHGINEQECVDISMRIAQKVGNELSIPVYLYENSAANPQRKNLAEIRKGNYEGFADKMKLQEWKPDFGPDVFNPKTGATVIGVRNFLIAYNINLNSTDTKAASTIAGILREKRFVKNSDGSVNEVQGRFKNCKAIGWFVPEYNCAQVSFNLINYKITSVHHVYEETKRLAAELGISVTGSEIIGLIPEEAIKEAGNFYLSRNDNSGSFSDNEIIQSAVFNLGLNDKVLFDPEKKILKSYYDLTSSSSGGY
ncbi:MAG: glutamate formimidoyltransferase [Ignavibacteria bacterium]|nr:glutamate formimidoyltransferase [Ignavibacteria bacterium]